MPVPISKSLLFYLEEDLSGGDITSDAVVPDVPVHAQIISKESGVIAGLFEACRIFSYLGVEAELKKRDSERVAFGDVLMTLSGSSRSVLAGERTALNVIGRMSGIATKTAEISAAVKKKNPSLRICGTRKTSPGCREIDKKAIILGGGDPHRSNLSDGFLIKDNHLVLCPLKEAVKKAKEYTSYKKVEVEVENKKDALSAAEAGADIILFDNMTPEAVSETVGALKSKGLLKDVVIEVSGGITSETVISYAVEGVDRISMGSLTHSVKNLDVSLEIKPAVKTLKINI
ncbi:nicotinate-nucleotide pyrophosphorylase (carboxylating) [Methanomicrobium sp. W14]|uniref:carboxylating nicotinate-nucleotide diphosphorylase n=1 Tax=Methanomicrobium sp. W14 TaxID=2817839 RepID=UPI001AEB7241|nr:carboxylating nicotinate-nucleotide diphosphorylase [Methanomicrobium sp. W14]MBP2134492.1 nicotinate-nucleotide pyrophosphorylase (carboxylating) [Methanomicrobium sp. W14]